MVELASRRYPPDFDLVAAEMWMRNIVLKQPMMFLPIRTDSAFVVCLIAVIPWLPSNWEANVIMCCAEDGKAWEVMGLLRATLEWAKKRKCVEWRMRTETAYDLGPMAKRLGAGVLPPCYVVRLDGST